MKDYLIAIENFLTAWMSTVPLATLIAGILFVLAAILYFAIYGFITKINKNDE